MRPSRRNVASSNDCAPIESRFTPAPRNRAAFAAVNVPGFASHVHSVTADNLSLIHI